MTAEKFELVMTLLESLAQRTREYHAEMKKMAETLDAQEDDEATDEQRARAQPLFDEICKLMDECF